MNTIWWIGLVTSVLVALAAANLDVPEPYKTVLTIGGIIGTAINGYLIRPARNPDEWQGPPGGRTRKADDKGVTP
jgi:hypothetical protein